MIEEQSIKLKTLDRVTANRPTVHPVRVMQFGGGNFLRAFCDWIFDVLNKTTDFNGSVAIVKPTKRGDYSELRSQDGLFHVALDGVRNGKLVSEITLVESVSQVIQPYTQWEDYLALAEQPAMRFIVSNTTEAGIKFSNADKQTDVPPQEFPAKLTLWLYHRFIHFNGEANKGCILLPCELIENNGDALKESILEYAKLWNLTEEFQTWIINHNYFCSTLVDRIVSGFPDVRKSEISKQIGFKDDLLVAGEDYHSWVIKGPALVQDELPFSKTDLNVQFVNDLSDYREMKVRVLNGAHTSLVPVGYLAGLRTVKESMDDEVVKNHVLQVLSTEVKPTLINFSDSDIDTFIASVIDRFKNPTLKHYLLAISLNSTSKFQARLLPAFREYTALKGTFPKRIAFSLACMIRFYKGEFNNETIAVNDDPKALEFFQNQWDKVDSGAQNLAELVENILTNEIIVGDDLSTYNGLVPFITSTIKDIETNGIAAALTTLNNSYGN
ncbi:tagaturonate reductase [Mariniflexile sp. AS56]|uniref:tagaturonate reductase n=1 Tax=Mariniflexile sp. AS56 TaxID=3063957 RepID=UPI0026EFA030|nr:tagaturonate reductase [Mariniflexile sp. AS56]MDO7172481.1 tagaturonate reductase [Mariniflexile sp. AS56]